MTAEELKRTRSVVFAPYEGYSESAGDIEYRYRFPMTPEKEDNNTASAYLTSVSVYRKPLDDSATITAFRASLAAALAAGRKVVACLTPKDTMQVLIVEFEPTDEAYLQIGYSGSASDFGLRVFERVSVEPAPETEMMSRRHCSAADIGR